jgi:transposase-like protein
MSAKPTARRYTDAERAEIVEHYRVNGQAKTLREYPGLSSSTLAKWRKAAGVQTEVVGTTQAATEARKANAKEHRAAAREDLAEATANLAKKIATITDVPPRELWQLATTIEVLTKVIRLEEGESTGRQEVSHEYPDIAALSDDELAAAILREAESITGGEA